MVELSITIVLIGILFAAIPGLLFRAVESDLSALEGEALYHAMAKMQEIISKPHNGALNNVEPRYKPYVLDYDSATNANSICQTAAGSIETTGIAALKASVPNLKRDAICTVATPQAIGLVSPQSAINHYDGWSETNFALGYKLEVFVRPLYDNRVASGFADKAVWTGFPAAAAQGDLLLITVRAAYVLDDETIGELFYVASNVGKR
jgi:hypothetical protein